MKNEPKPKRGRPVLTAPRVAVTWRLPVNLLFRVDEVAEATGVTTTAFVENALNKALAARARQAPRKRKA